MEQREFRLRFKIGTDVRIIDAMRRRVNDVLNEYPGEGEISEIPDITVGRSESVESYFLYADEARWLAFLNRAESFMPKIEHEVCRELDMMVVSA